MVKLSCSHYGYDCDFVADGETEDVISKFGDHTLNEHGIEYSKESLMQFVMRIRT
jgi:predicted small metal-binding protein